MSKLIIILLAIVLTSCGARDVTDNDIKVSSSIEQAKSACYKAVSAQSKADTSMIQSIKESDRTMATMVYLNNRQTALLVSAVTGHSLDKCAGTNLWDFLTAEAEAKNKALSAGLGHAVTAVKWIAGAWAVTEIAGQIGSTYSSEGQSYTSTTQNADSGNTSTSSKDSYNTVNDSPNDSNVNTNTSAVTN